MKPDYGNSEYDKVRAFMREEREKKRWLKNALLFIPRMWWRGFMWLVTH